MKNIIGIGLLILVGLMISCSSEADDKTPVSPDKPIVTPGEDDKTEDVVAPHDFLMGALFSFQKNLRNGVDSYNGGTTSTTFYNKPLFEAKAFNATNEEWWNNLVEEFVYSGLDYVAVNCRGRLPKADTDSKYYADHGDPTRIPDLIAAMERRGVEDLKIAIFDDCPTSWAATRNLDLYGKYTSALTATDQAELGLTDQQMLYPIDDLDDIYKYIWDYNLKLAFENFYGDHQQNNKYLLRYNGKPVVYMWNVNGFLNINYAALGGTKPNCAGKLKAILEKVRADFKATFGEDVFLCIDKAFIERDEYILKSDVEAVNDWFVASEQAANRHSYSLRKFNDIRVGVAVPAFLTSDKSGTRMFFDSDHGARLTEALDYMVDNSADLILLEGFTDMAENAAYWRSTDTKFYDYPNQRLNILRHYSSKNAYPKSLRVEAEACDLYQDNSVGNSGNQYRQGDLDVKTCTDVFDGWCVTAVEEGEWLKWMELPYCDGRSTVRLRYASQSGIAVRLDVDDKEGTVVYLPATDGVWKDGDIASVTFSKKKRHDTTLHIVTGAADLNYFTIVSAQ